MWQSNLASSLYISSHSTSASRLCSRYNGSCRASSRPMLLLGYLSRLSCSTSSLAGSLCIIFSSAWLGQYLRWTCPGGLLFSGCCGTLFGVGALKHGLVSLCKRFLAFGISLNSLLPLVSCSGNLNVFTTRVLSFIFDCLVFVCFACSLENWYYRILILMAGYLNNTTIAVDALSVWYVTCVMS